MSYQVNRRFFLLGSAGCVMGILSPPLQNALAAPARKLTIDRRTIEVNGRAASVFGIFQPDGTSGLTLGPSDAFKVDLINRTGEDTIIHWHGQKPPYAQDGVADRNIPLIPAKAANSYDYRPTPGTHWMHSHHGLQEQLLMAAPLVVRSAEDEKADIQEITVLLHDFSFRDPKEILGDLTKRRTAGGQGAAHDMSTMGGMDHSSMANMNHSASNESRHHRPCR